MDLAFLASAALVGLALLEMATRPVPAEAPPELFARTLQFLGSTF